MNKKVIIISVVVLAVGVGAYFLLRKPNDNRNGTGGNGGAACKHSNKYVRGDDNVVYWVDSNCAKTHWPSWVKQQGGNPDAESGNVWNQSVKIPQAEINALTTLVTPA